MIAKAIDKIVEMAAPNRIHTGDATYVDKKLYLVHSELTAEPIRVSTLTGFVQYINQFAEQEKKDFPYFIHVMSPTSVEFVSALDSERRRETIVMAVAEVPDLKFGRFIPNEEMTITIQSKFVNDEDTDKALLLKFTGSVTSGSIKEYGDDGVTQKATIRNGVASKIESVVPSPCLLRPYRTFMEVEQPASKFIFRMQQGYQNTVESALFEADGGAWKSEAMSNIAEYLRANCEGYVVIS